MAEQGPPFRESGRTTSAAITCGAVEASALWRAHECLDSQVLFWERFLVRWSAMVWHQSNGRFMRKHKVEFDAHKTVKQETEVAFTKRDGTPIDFVANKPVKVPVHVKFTARKNDD